VLDAVMSRCCSWSSTSTAAHRSGRRLA
jgi:hypothetical protein